MTTNLHILDRLINKAVKLGGHRTKKEAVTQALVAYVNHLEQEKIIPLFGTVDFDARYDHKKQRALLLLADTRIGPTRHDIDRLRAAEAERRVAEIDPGKVKLIPGKNVFEKVRRKYA